jgi:predicted RNA-binding protein
MNINNMKDCYVLIKGDSFRKCGKQVSAYDATLALLEANIWPLYKRTANRKSLKYNDKVLFYVSGTRPGSKRFLARAKVLQAEDWTRHDDTINPLFSENIPYTALKFKEIEIFSEPPEIRQLLSKLSFITSKKHWGVAFMSGTRKIPERDFKTIVGERI